MQRAESVKRQPTVFKRSTILKVISSLSFEYMVRSSKPLAYSHGIHTYTHTSSQLQNQTVCAYAMNEHEISTE